MREHIGNLWNVPCDVRVISTNGSINRREDAVMGRGCALEAKQRYPELPHRLADCLQEGGNIPYYFPDLQLVTFPVKRRWHDKAELDLIVSSACALKKMTDKYSWQTVAMPRVGCGNGRLRWAAVQLILVSILDDRFVICSFMEG